MNIISRCENIKMRLLTGSSLELLYSKLRSCLSAEQLSVFARPTVKTNETIWSVDFDGVVTPLSRCDDETRAEAITQLELRRNQIMDNIEKDAELSPVASKLFVIPAQDQIFCYRDHRQKLVIVMAQWACSRLDGSVTTDVLSFLLGSPLSRRSRAGIRILYSDGTPAGEFPFTFEYNEIVRSLQTDLSGGHDLGFLKIGSEFTITPDSSDRFPAKTFTVEEGIEKYELIVPRRATLIVKVVGEDEAPVVGSKAELEYEGHTSQLLTGRDGLALQADLEAGKTVRISVPDTVEGVVDYRLSADDNCVTFKKIGAKIAVLKVITESANGIRIPETPFVLRKAGGETVSCMTDQSGLYVTEAVQPGESVMIALVNDENAGQYVMEAGDNLVKLVVKSEEQTNPVSILLIDQQDKPVSGALMKFRLISGDVVKTTDPDGKTSIPANSFSEGEVVRVTIEPGAELRKKRTSFNIFRKRFTYQRKQEEYILKLGKRFAYLWALLFLLPLLLLIRCEKDIRVKAVHADGKTPAPDLAVNFAYNRSFLYDDGDFFSSTEISLQQKTDSGGIAVFEKLEYSIFSFVVLNLSKVFLNAQGTCVSSDTIRPYFHYQSGGDYLELIVQPVPVAADFIALDSTDNEPLPGARVSIISDLTGYVQYDTAVTEANGRVVFSKLPKCGKVIRLEASLDGYYPCNLGAGSVSDLVAGRVEDRRTLKLIPVTEKIVFFVKNCANNQPLPDASATITLERGGGTKKVQKISTNVNGVGKGSYDNVHVIADIDIAAEKKYFKPGKLARKYQVRDFVKLPDSLRTFCLEPETSSMDFTDIDAKTRKPLAGVNNVVTIINGGKETRKETLMGNGNGIFTVGGLIFGDEISIHSSHPPYYSDNDYTIRNRDVIKLLEAGADQREIPLKPKEVDLKFRTVDEETDSLVSNATLTVLIDGSVSRPSNSGSGEFNVRALYSSSISIVAEKIGYERNDTKIKDKAASFLLGADQLERDIPMKLKPEIKVNLEIYNKNSEADEVFLLSVNGNVIDTVSHTAKAATRSVFSISVKPETENIIELIFQPDKSPAANDTGSMLSIEPGKLSAGYKGDNKSFRFRYNAAKVTLAGPELF